MDANEKIIAHEYLIELLYEIRSCDKAIEQLGSSVLGIGGQTFPTLNDKWLKEIMIETSKKQALESKYNHLAKLCRQ